MPRCAQWICYEFIFAADCRRRPNESNKFHVDASFPPPRQGHKKRATNDHDYALSKTTGGEIVWRLPVTLIYPLPGQVNSNLKAHNADNADNVVCLRPTAGAKNISIWHCFRFQFACCCRRHLQRADCLQQLSKIKWAGPWGQTRNVAVLLSALAVKNNKY